MSCKTNFNCLNFSFLALFLLFLQSSIAQSNFSSLETAIEGKRKLLGNDFMVFVASPDTVVYQKAFGDMNNKTQVPIGASSNLFTTVLVLQLADEGKISLDDKISKYLPIFESYGKGYITIRHCLSHITGIQSEAFKLASFLIKKKYNSLDEEVNDFAKKEIQANTGEEFRYNNMGLNIAARVAEVVTKKKFDQLMRQKIFAPLGMRNTTFTTDDGSALNPSIGAKSTAADYIRFLQMLLNKGRFNNKQILSENAMAEMRKVQVAKERMKFVPKGTEGFQYTLGIWAVEGPVGIGTTATALALPGLTGTWSAIDFSRSYTYIIFPKNFEGEQKAATYLELKALLDQNFRSLAK
jgi:CubicO group peptidase (beta-lactamase class C family)